jgi:hypothetical protein
LPNSPIAADIERFAKAICCRNDVSPTMREQAITVAESEEVLLRIRAARLSAIASLGMHAGVPDDPISVRRGEAAGKSDSLEHAIVRLERLERYERRALSRRKRAIRSIMKIASES